MAALYCAICGKFVKFDSRMIDEQDRTVHKECLAAQCGAKKPPQKSHQW
jgi:hypothetical protein